MAPQTGLADLLKLLDSLQARDFREQRVSRLLSRIQVPVDDLAEYANFWSRSYARNLIHRTDLYEVILLAWLPAQKTRIHDHGGQLCWTSVVQGRLTFQDFAPFENEQTAPTAVGAPYDPPQGSMIFSEDSAGMHSIANRGPQHALSLHIYSRPLDRCRVWNPDLEQFEWKRPSYFTTPEAWAETGPAASDGTREEPPLQ